MDESIYTANKKQSRQKPPLSLYRIAGQILAGTILCIVVLVVVYVILVKLFGLSDFTGSNVGIGEMGALVIFIIFFYPLYMIDSALGVYLVGTRGNQTGSFGVTLGFSFLGILVTFLLFWKGLLSLTEDKIVTLGLILLIGPIMSTIGFNLTRKYKELVLPRNSKYFVSYR